EAAAMSRASLAALGATLFACVASIACTANVEDLGAPGGPTAPLNVDDERCRTVVHGADCHADDPLSCNPTSTLQCICGVDMHWVCLDATLGLLTERAIAAGDPCAVGVHYQRARSICSCD